MPADQAAGLRRQRARQPLRCISCFSDSPDLGIRLAHALHGVGRASLLVDTQGRIFDESSPRSLFDWAHQLERGQLHTLPQAYGEGWYAPGVRTDEPALSGLASSYDYVLFDSDWRNAELALLPQAAHTVVLAVQRTGESMQHAYALLKTLACWQGACSVGLLGDRQACEQVRAAASRFLGQAFAQAVFSLANEDDAFAELAVRMTGEETGPSAR